MSAGPVGLICGGGALPLEAADSIRRMGRDVFLVGLKGFASNDIGAFPHGWVRLGEVGKLFRILEGAGARDIAMIGEVRRPALRDLGLDMLGLASVPEFTRLFRGGDDHLLRGVIGFIERRGFRVHGVHEFAADMTASTGPLGRHAPSPEDEADIAVAVDLLAALGPFDVGQGVVVVGRRVVAVEAAEGTDAMLGRVARLVANKRIRRDGRGGVFVKTPKSTQDLRVDLPAIGPQTIAKAAEAGLAGVAIAAGQVLVTEREATIAAADASGLFLVGLPVVTA